MKWLCRCGTKFEVEDISKYVEGVQWLCPTCWDFFKTYGRLDNLYSREKLDFLRVKAFQDDREKDTLR